MKRGEVYWADLPPPSGRRPLLVLSRSKAIPHLNAVVVAEITSTVRMVPSEVSLGKREGLPRPCAANLDNINTVPKSALDEHPAGHLATLRLRELDEALRFALGIRN